MLGVSTVEVSKKLLEKGLIGPKEILGFSKWNFSPQILASVLVSFAVNFLIGVLSSFRTDKEENPRWLKFAFQTKI